MFLDTNPFLNQFKIRYRDMKNKLFLLESKQKTISKTKTLQIFYGLYHSCIFLSTNKHIM